MSSNATLDRFWAAFKAHEPDVEFGGIDADKPGYHNQRRRLPGDDYSVGQVAADRRGADDVAAAIDITLPAAKMRLYTGRLQSAALTHDPRLWLYSGPTLREYIGTTNGRDVECYVFTGGRPLGVAGDSGFDFGRDTSHLWHIHLSVIRQYAEDWAALDAVLSVLKGESLAAWRARTQEDDVGTLEGDQAKQLAYNDVREEAWAKGSESIRQTPVAPAGGTHWGVTTLAGVARTVTQLAADVAEIKARPAPGTVEISDEQLERVLRKVIGSVDGATPQA